MAVAEHNHIVNNFTIGNTRVNISDLYCRNRTDEEVEVVLKRIAWRAQQAIASAEQPDLSQTSCCEDHGENK